MKIVLRTTYEVEVANVFARNGSLAVRSFFKCVFRNVVIFFLHKLYPIVCTENYVVHFIYVRIMHGGSRQM